MEKDSAQKISTQLIDLTQFSLRPHFLSSQNLAGFSRTTKHSCFTSFLFIHLLQKRADTRAEHELAQAKLALDKEVKQAIVNANTSYEKYTLLETEVEKCREALRQLQSKYEYIFRTKIIDFYTGISFY